MFDTRSQTALTAWLTVTAAAAVATVDPGRWALDVTGTLQGEWWRLATGHLVHLTWQHFLFDLLALGLALWLCSRLMDGFTAIAVTALVSCAAVSTVLLITQPVDIYGGLSGITSGLLSFAALQMTALDETRVGGIVLTACLLFKVALEWQGLSVSGVPVVWQAHCAGAAAGAFVSACTLKQEFRISSGRGIGGTP